MLIRSWFVLNLPLGLLGARRTSSRGLSSQCVKERFPTIRYIDLIFNGGKVTKAAWVLPEEDQTAETGTLADFLESLGTTVQEIDLDAGDDEDDDAERDGDGFVDDEAEEEEGDDEQDA